MNDLQNKLYSRISQSISNLDYQDLFRWIDDTKRDGIEKKLRSPKDLNKYQSEAKEIYYGLQAFHFALSAENIETVTLNWVIYPAWERLLRPYAENWSEFSPERLDYVSCQKHADAIFESFKKITPKLQSNVGGPMPRIIVIPQHKSIAAFFGALELDCLRAYYDSNLPFLVNLFVEYKTDE